MFSAYTDTGLNALELNFSYYKMPDEKMLKNFSLKAPDKFVYIIKANRGITHDRQNDEISELFAETYNKSNEKKTFKGVLFQFPESFHYNMANVKYIEKTVKTFNNIPCFIEFRGRDWNNDNVFQFLKEYKLNYVITDLPPNDNLHKKELNITSNTAYYRLHGRNTDWYNYDERYNYNYMENELLEIEQDIKRLEKKADNVFVFFNNCHGGFALMNALTIKNRMIINE